MLSIATFIQRFYKDEQGVTSIEYALMGALIAVVIIAAVGSVGTNLKTLYADIATQIGNAIVNSL